MHNACLCLCIIESKHQWARTVKWIWKAGERETLMSGVPSHFSCSFFLLGLPWIKVVCGITVDSLNNHRRSQMKNNAGNLEVKFMPEIERKAQRSLSVHQRVHACHESLCSYLHITRAHACAHARAHTQFLKWKREVCSRVHACGFKPDSAANQLMKLHVKVYSLFTHQ